MDFIFSSTPRSFQFEYVAKIVKPDFIKQRLIAKQEMREITKSEAKTRLNLERRRFLSYLLKEKMCERILEKLTTGRAVCVCLEIVDKEGRCPKCKQTVCLRCLEVKRPLADHWCEVYSDIDVEFLENAAFVKEELDETQGAIKDAEQRICDLMKVIKDSELVTCGTYGCVGGVKGEDRKCQLCQKVTCLRCQESSESPNHECDPDVLKTIALIKKESKKCPSCEALIHKIDGCDQMFCTQCHTAFSWNTLVIESGKIHNPHYYEWLRNAGRVVPRDADDERGRQAGQDEEDLKKAFHGSEIFSDIWLIDKALDHIEILVGRLRRFIEGNLEKNKLRNKHIKRSKEGVRWSNVEKSEKIWFQQLCSLFKRKEMAKDLIGILQMMDACLKDIALTAYRTALRDGLEGPNAWPDLNKQRKELSSYCSKQIKANGEKYGLTNKTYVSMFGIVVCELDL